MDQCALEVCSSVLQWFDLMKRTVNLWSNTKCIYDIMVVQFWARDPDSLSKKGKFNFLFKCFRTRIYECDNNGLVFLGLMSIVNCSGCNKNWQNNFSLAKQL